MSGVADSESGDSVGRSEGIPANKTPTRQGRGRGQGQEDEGVVSPRAAPSAKEDDSDRLNVSGGKAKAKAKGNAKARGKRKRGQGGGAPPTPASTNTAGASRDRDSGQAGPAESGDDDDGGGGGGGGNAKADDVDAGPRVSQDDEQKGGEICTPSGDGDDGDDEDGDDEEDDDDGDDDGRDAVLQRKASLGRDAAENLRDPNNYKRDDIVWVKLPQYQYWPSVVVKTTGKVGRKGNAKLYFNAINDGPDDHKYSIDLSKVGVAAKGKDPPRDVQRFKGATMQRYYQKALSCHTLKDGGVRDAALLASAFERAKRIIQEKANGGSPSHASPGPAAKKSKMYASMSSDSDDTDDELDATNPEEEQDDAEVTEEDRVILGLRKPFQDGAACLDALRASEGTIRGIVAGTHPSALYERYKSEGAARFKNSISTGPFKDEEEQVEPVVDVLREWFPGREHFTLVDEVLLEEALRLVVMKINDVDADAAKAFMERKQWLTSQERRALAKSKPANGTNSTLSSSSADSSGVE